ncbi:Predicted membrane protein [Mucilaginibacter pineti]|uniref:Predicted membrane protein n=1 Tax=Mucilaginibacter pineti TaxID=1391627 RepID=A0A1G7FQW3_9SPHI|nr:DUF2306 domain-containing protein [Mucilaginibacter pineti]SDE78297.1 Predicted membrane protein [Mucilaginibacter pineti]
MGIVRYLPMQDNIGFLQFKQDYIHILPWKIAFYTHVFTVIFALLAGFTQFSSSILKGYKNVHRLMGKIYACDILFINFPAAMIMAVYANGQLPGKIAFVVLDCLWFWFTYKAVAEIKKGNVLAHKQFMIRSYALTVSAVTLRCWKIVILSFVYVEPLHLYMIDAWMGFVPNLLFAEWLIKKKQKPLPFNTQVVK